MWKIDARSAVFARGLKACGFFFPNADQLREVHVGALQRPATMFGVRDHHHFG
jgi:hypothetical protein